MRRVYLNICSNFSTERRRCNIICPRFSTWRRRCNIICSSFSTVRERWNNKLVTPSQLAGSFPTFRKGCCHWREAFPSSGKVAVNWQEAFSSSGKVAVIGRKLSHVQERLLSLAGSFPVFRKGCRQLAGAFLG